MLHVLRDAAALATWLHATAAVTASTGKVEVGQSGREVARRRDRVQAGDRGGEDDRRPASNVREPEGLRTFGPGQTGFGNHVPTSLPLPAGGGLGPVEIIAEVDVNGPECGGSQIAYGLGLAGSGGAVPQLGAVGCPDIGNPFTIAIEGVVGGPVLVVIPLVVGGAAGVAHAGSLALPVVIADPILAGVNIHLQGAFADAAALQGVSLTNGLRLLAAEESLAPRLRNARVTEARPGELAADGGGRVRIVAEVDRPQDGLAEVLRVMERPKRGLERTDDVAGALDRSLPGGLDP